MYYVYMVYVCMYVGSYCLHFSHLHVASSTQVMLLLEGRAQRRYIHFSSDFVIFFFINLQTPLKTY